MAVTGPSAPAGAPRPDGGREAEAGRTMTIGTVSKLLGEEFPDISISKLRYLEGQKLLAPRRTGGGYRLYSAADVERLRTILRLQRDEYMPLRVIRQELAQGTSTAGAGGAAGTDPTAGARSSRAARVPRPRFAEPVRRRLTTDEVLERAPAADGALLTALADYGLIEPGREPSGRRSYSEVDADIVVAASELTRYGVAARNLRTLRSSAEREAGLLEQVLAPAVRSKNPDRRRHGLEQMEELAVIASRLRHLLLVAELERFAG